MFPHLVAETVLRQTRRMCLCLLCLEHQLTEGRSAESGRKNTVIRRRSSRVYCIRGCGNSDTNRTWRSLSVHNLRVDR